MLKFRDLTSSKPFVQLDLLCPVLFCIVFADVCDLKVNVTDSFLYVLSERFCNLLSSKFLIGSGL